MAEPRAGIVVAPSLLEIKNAYLQDFDQQADFVKGLTAFMLRPSVENARMKGAVKQYGMMPDLSMSKQHYDAVATYIFLAELEDSLWYENYQEELANLQAKDEADTLDYLQQGLDIALATKAVLGKNLLTAIKTRGTAEALSFCNERAAVLTDSMAMKLNAKVRRVSDKNRNPDQAAGPEELAYIQYAHATLKEGNKPKPQIQEMGGKQVGYYPIMTNAMCLQCHGDADKDIDPATLGKLKDLYPMDKAIGYGVNELRGIWVVEMEP